MRKTAIKIYPPGDFIQEELEARDMTRERLSDVTGMSIELINDIMDNHARINVGIAAHLADAFNTNIIVWLNLSMAYRKSKGGADNG